MFLKSVLFLSYFSLMEGWIFNEVRYNPKFFLDSENGYNDSVGDTRDLGVYEENDLDPEMQERLVLIFPGTKWCGSGDIADSYDDLGPAAETDKCCRDHDHCPDAILAGETKNNLTNDSFYSRLSCECDEKFRQCLHDAHAPPANHVGKMYFNVIGTQCFKKDYPVKGCIKQSGWFKKKCVKYSYDQNGRKRFQWFDVPNY